MNIAGAGHIAVIGSTSIIARELVKSWTGSGVEVFEVCRSINDGADALSGIDLEEPDDVDRAIDALRSIGDLDEVWYVAGVRPVPETSGHQMSMRAVHAEAPVRIAGALEEDRTIGRFHYISSGFAGRDIPGDQMDAKTKMEGEHGLREVFKGRPDGLHIHRIGPVRTPMLRTRVGRLFSVSPERAAEALLFSGDGASTRAGRLWMLQDRMLDAFWPVSRSQARHR